METDTATDPKADPDSPEVAGCPAPICYAVGSRVVWNNWVVPREPWHVGVVIGRQHFGGALCHRLAESSDGADLINFEVVSHHRQHNAEADRLPTPAVTTKNNHE